MVKFYIIFFIFKTYFKLEYLHHRKNRMKMSILIRGFVNRFREEIQAKTSCDFYRKFKHKKIIIFLPRQFKSEKN